MLVLLDILPLISSLLLGLRPRAGSCACNDLTSGKLPQHFADRGHCWCCPWSGECCNRCWKNRHPGISNFADAVICGLLWLRIRYSFCNARKLPIESSSRVHLESLLFGPGYMPGPNAEETKFPARFPNCYFLCGQRSTIPRRLLDSSPQARASAHGFRTWQTRPELNGFHVVAEWHSRPTTSLAQCLPKHSTVCWCSWGRKANPHSWNRMDRGRLSANYVASFVSSEMGGN